MRDLNQYSQADWLQAKPAVAAFKEVRDGIVRDFYCARGTAALNPFLEAHRNLRDGVVAITIAFEQPWLVDNLIQRFGKFSRDAQLIICDNSRTAEAKKEIEAVAAAADIPYLALPANLVRNVNRSHGTALNWVYRNVVQQLKPRIFGFIDHDLFPSKPFSFAELLGDQPIYGQKIDQSFGWALWAGYCIFDRGYVAKRKPDFNPDMDRKLVTGGRNYGRIYRHLDPSRLRFATHELRRYDSPIAGEPQLLSELVDGWLHVMGSSYHKEKIAARAFYQQLIDQL